MNVLVPSTLRPWLKGHQPVSSPWCTLKMQVDWQDIVETVFIAVLSFMPGSRHGGLLLVELAWKSSMRIRSKQRTQVHKSHNHSFPLQVFPKIWKTQKLSIAFAHFCASTRQHMLDTSRNIMVLLPFPANHYKSFFSFLIVGFENCFSEGRGGIEEHFNTWEKEVFRGKRQSTYSQDQLEAENTTERDTNWEMILYLLFICSHNRWVLAWLKFSMK